MKHSFRSILILPFTLLLTACSYLPYQYVYHPLEAPQIELLNIHFEKGSLFEQHFIAKVRLHNPNDRTVPIKSLHVALDINNITVGKGTYRQAFLLPADGDAIVKIDIQSDLFASISSI